MCDWIRAASIAALMTATVAVTPGGARAAQTESLTGEWIGRLDLGSQPAFLRITMAATRNPDYTYRVIPRANHSFHRVAPSFLAVTGYVPEYFQTMVQWLTRVTRTREPR